MSIPPPSKNVPRMLRALADSPRTDQAERWVIAQDVFCTIARTDAPSSAANNDAFHHEMLHIVDTVVNGGELLTAVVRKWKECPCCEALSGKIANGQTDFDRTPQDDPATPEGVHSSQPRMRSLLRP